MIPERTFVLRSGRTQPVEYRRCHICGKYVRALNARNWCDCCEQEFATTKEAVRQILKRARENTACWGWIR